ncbi:hypothetical protein BN137_3907 [Cronobacter condimenti 1330]|uniref:Uncharacterized protein n=1 Tax=Cronobacter condimenti 1330 TaxID=1073999 RepID=K8AFE8_9ENTR|nr:hypothetical protein BN137_3907 [Cronobacter condimenti 1330]
MGGVFIAYSIMRSERAPFSGVTTIPPSLPAQLPPSTLEIS